MPGIGARRGPERACAAEFDDHRRRGRSRDHAPALRRQSAVGDHRSAASRPAAQSIAPRSARATCRARRRSQEPGAAGANTAAPKSDSRPASGARTSLAAAPVARLQPVRGRRPPGPGGPDVQARPAAASKHHQPSAPQDRRARRLRAAPRQPGIPAPRTARRAPARARARLPTATCGRRGSPGQLSAPRTSASPGGLQARWPPAATAEPQRARSSGGSE